MEGIKVPETVKNKKPDPEVYFTIMNHFGVKPEDCLIFEDSFTGVLAANRAGIEVVNVYDKYSDVDRDKINEITDYSIQTYNEFIAKCEKDFGLAPTTPNASEGTGMKF